MKKTVSVLNITDFRHFSRDHDFYAETFLPHIRQHDFTNKPHKHDFFMVVLFTKGSGTHEIDFKTYKIGPGAMFFLSPGQTHQWRLSKEGDGLIFFHTREFFEKSFGRLDDFSFYASVYNLPVLYLKKTVLPVIKSIFSEILIEYRLNEPMKERKLLSLVNILYVEMERLFKPTVHLNHQGYLFKFRHFEDLVEKRFKENKSPGVYAEKMHITERHLNRICKISVNKTSSGIITDRVVLEAKRLLMHSDVAISEVALELGYEDNSYFSRLFKKATGQTPKKFSERYK